MLNKLPITAIKPRIITRKLTPFMFFDFLGLNIRARNEI